ncbi:hypothetical protein [Sphingobacterium wenxiniae]|uniref:hypothetical protein n=1 Tax=Sphingobacterium wenxiniae TaxID=683125 RepID=UPI0014817E28|nr:hypothetical protein [Sphingobacterium wenxiniae]
MKESSPRPTYLVNADVLAFWSVAFTKGLFRCPQKDGSDLGEDLSFCPTEF